MSPLRASLILALLISLPGCRGDWDAMRDEVVLPLETLLAVDYARGIRARDLPRVVALHGPAVADDARRDLGELLAGFMQIERTRCLIREVHETDEDGVFLADCLLRYDGVGTEGNRRTLYQDQRLRCARISGAWRIVDRSVDPLREVFAENTPTFVEEAAARGLVFAHTSRGVRKPDGTLEPYPGGSGATAADVNGDGLDDLLLISGGEMRLFINMGGRFEDQTKAYGLVPEAKGEYRCGFFGDVDNDGDLDLFVSRFDAKNLLLMNDGGTFRSVPESVSGLSSTEQTSSACFGDFDGDGDLDLYLANGMNLAWREPEPIYNAKNGTPNQYFRNRGDGTFEEATEESGTGDTGWALACTVTDYDLDGDLDILVANDFGSDTLFSNNGDGTFEDAGQDAGIVYRTASMSSDFADVNGDGYPDLFVSGMASNARWVVRMRDFPVPAPALIAAFIGNWIIDTMWEVLRGNRLYYSQGDGTFKEVSEPTGTRDLEWGWGSVFLDYDNDGDMDLYGSNGFLTGESDAEL